MIVQLYEDGGAPVLINARYVVRCERSAGEEATIVYLDRSACGSYDQTSYRVAGTIDEVGRVLRGEP